MRNENPIIKTFTIIKRHLGMVCPILKEKRKEVPNETKVDDRKGMYMESMTDISPVKSDISGGSVNSVDKKTVIEPSPVPVIAFEGLSSSEVKCLKKTAPSILLNSAEIIKTDDGRFAMIIPLERYLVDVIDDIIIMIVLEAHYDGGSFFSDEADHYVDIVCKENSLHHAMWLISENSYFIKADKTGFIYGHMTVDTDGNENLCCDHICSLDKCINYRNELEIYASSLRNPISTSSEKVAMALIRKRMDKKTESDSNRIVTEADRRKFSVAVCSLLRIRYISTYLEPVSLKKYIRFASNLIGDAVLNQTLQQAYIVDESFDENYLDPMIVSKDLTQYDVDAVITLADEYNITLDRYYFASHRLRNLRITYTFANKISKQGCGQRDMVRNAERNIQEIRHLYPGKEDYIWRKMVELEAGSYSITERPAHKNPNCYILLDGYSTIQKEFDEEARKSVNSDNNSVGPLEPIPLDPTDDSISDH